MKGGKFFSAEADIAAQHNVSDRNF
jgi:hypothetical protein